MTALRVAALLLIAATIAIVALSWIPSYVDDEPDEPPPTTLAPGPR